MPSVALRCRCILSQSRKTARTRSFQIISVSLVEPSRTELSYFSSIFVFFLASHINFLIILLLLFLQDFAFTFLYFDYIDICTFAVCLSDFSSLLHCRHFLWLRLTVLWRPSIHPLHRRSANQPTDPSNDRLCGTEWNCFCIWWRLHIKVDHKIVNFFYRK